MIAKANITPVIEVIQSFNPDSEFITDLYHRCYDEPDFDCEFLNSVSYDSSESIIDIESEDELTDEFNDNQWDVEIYDPYLESTYY